MRIHFIEKIAELVLERIPLLGNGWSYRVVRLPSKLDPKFGLNTGKYEPEITPYLDTFFKSYEW